MNILIIGGSRFVGPLLVFKLLKKGHKITIFNRGKIKSSYEKEIRFIQGNRNDGFNIKDNFDVVIDMCAYNGLHTERAINELNFDFYINFGTAASYKKTDKFPLSEDSPLGSWPLWSSYNKGKVECEEVLKQKKINYATIRPVYILGANNYMNREKFIYSKIKDKSPIILPGDGKAKIQFVFAEDVANSIVILTERTVKGEFNCCGNKIITLKKLVEEMGKIVGIKPILKFNSSADGEKFDENEFPFANENFFCTNKKIKDLGMRFTPLVKGLKQDYESYYKRII